jgi:[ribosomal protein S5]-alanine N-acetyltransferase
VTENVANSRRKVRKCLGFPLAGSDASSDRYGAKQGMRIAGIEERDYVSGRLAAEIGEITAAEWRARRSKPQPSDRS